MEFAWRCEECGHTFVGWGEDGCPAHRGPDERGSKDELHRVKLYAGEDLRERLDEMEEEIERRDIRGDRGLSFRDVEDVIADLKNELGVSGQKTRCDE
ncbi:hypothetical protein [Natrinema salinisoli]|uniref:hypothetical protein n=1 Tax=Natrinema salinisoli TaxID=2878535 RepID=UPI001CF00F4F|nr:hypothetical protein [Natrinema salinisoli]